MHTPLSVEPTNSRVAEQSTAKGAYATAAGAQACDRHQLKYSAHEATKTGTRSAGGRDVCAWTLGLFSLFAMEIGRGHS